jgi:Zinc-finger of C2H2 type/C2H2-type zinc finger
VSLTTALQLKKISLSISTSAVNSQNSSCDQQNIERTDSSLLTNPKGGADCSVSPLAKPTIKRVHACDFCPDNFPTFSALKTHVWAVHKAKPLKCDVCQVRFRDKAVLRVHAEAKHSEKRHPCDVCGKSFTAQRSVKN